MKNLILIKTEGKADYYLTTCPIFDETRDKDLRDFKEDIKNAYEGLTGLNCKAWFVDDIKPKNFNKAKTDFFNKCKAFYQFDNETQDWVTDNSEYATMDVDTFGICFRFQSWGKGFTDYHIVIQLGQDTKFKGLSYRGVSHAEAAQFLGLWIESCINN